MSKLIMNTLSAWSLIEAMNPATIKDINSKLKENLFSNYESQAKYQDAKNYQAIWLEENFFINKKHTKSERRFKYLRLAFRQHYIDDCINRIFGDKSETYNKSRTLCYSYHFEVDDQGKYIGDSLYVPMIMSALKSLEANRNADNLHHLYKNSIEKFEFKANETFANGEVDNQKINELDKVYREYFYYFNFDNKNGYFENYIEIQHVNLNEQVTEMNSFYIEDIEKAQYNVNETLKTYIEGIDESNRIIVDENRKYIEKILTPNKYPDGRWPSLVEHKLSLMQQVAVNQITNNNQVISSVNGPPGTGKTTLLKDIFAHYVVERAKNISKLNNPGEAFRTKKINETDQYPTHFVNSSLTKFKMAVTSSNNGAVENISKDLPKYSEVLRDVTSTSEFPEYEEGYSQSAEDLFEFQSIASTLIDEPAWGVFSGVFGKKKNIDTVIDVLLGSGSSESNEKITLNKLLIKLKEEKDVTKEWKKIKSEFEAELNAVKTEKQNLTKLLNLYNKVKSDERIVIEMERDLQDLIEQKNKSLNRIKDVDYSIEDIDIQIQQQHEVVSNLKNNKGIIEKVMVLIRGETEKVVSAQNIYNELVNEKRILFEEKKGVSSKIFELERNEELLINKLKKHGEDKVELNKQSQEYSGLIIPDKDFWVKENYDNRQESLLWVSDKLQYHRGQLFLKAMVLHKILLIDNSKKVQGVLYDFKRRNEYLDIAPEKVENAWNLIHLIFPVISTTFASFGRMYKTMPKNFIDYLFVDEAGQAIPQAAVGALYRSKNAIVVGDPIQIEPVVTLGKNLIDRIRKVYNIPERLLSVESSVQSLADNSNQFGFYKEEDDERQWIGIPLWVHRRCLNPMYSIANEIAYDNKMVLPRYIKKDEAEGKTGITKWFDSTGRAVSQQHVKEHGEVLVELIIGDWQEAIEKNESEPNVYVISPFSEVKSRLKALLKSKLKIAFNNNEDINFNKWINNSVGTVHTFQGKEADKVYFVIGTDETQNGAAQWSCMKPNLLNVAVTRAKKEFYIIGDNKRLRQMQYYQVIDKFSN